MRGPGSADARIVRARRRVAGLWLCLLGGLGLAACDGPRSASPTVRILAASSLADALPPVIAPLNHRDGLRVEVVFAASSTLARQIEAGAPADVFFSADEAWLDRLIDSGHIEAASRKITLSNRVVVIAPRASDIATADSGVARPAQVFARLAPEQRVVMGDPAHVPAGRYARAALESLGLWSNVQGQVAFADNVRAALALVDRGEAALGIVYATDVALSDNVAVVATLPMPADRPVRYAMGLAAGLEGDRRRRAQRTYDALLTPAAYAHYTSLGFTRP